MSVGPSRTRRLWNVLSTTRTQRRALVHALRRLDACRPTWYRDVDVDLLRMNHARRCVLGQLYGDYDTGRRKLYPYVSYPLFELLNPDGGARAFVGTFPRRLWVAEVLRYRAAEVARTDAWCDLPSLAPDLPDVARRELLDANDRGETFAELVDRVGRLP